MDAYSLDLRKKIVDAKQRGMPTSEVARTFGVGASTVKRYAAAAREGRLLAPKKRPGSKPKMDEGARRLLERDMKERPAATLPRGASSCVGPAGWRSATRRSLGCSGAWDGAEKKIGGSERTRRVPEGRLEDAGGRRDRREPLRVRRRVLDKHLVAPAVRVVEAGRAGFLLGSA